MSSVPLASILIVVIEIRTICVIFIVMSGVRSLRQVAGLSDLLTPQLGALAPDAGRRIDGKKVAAWRPDASLGKRPRQRNHRSAALSAIGDDSQLAIAESSNDAILIRGLDHTILSWNAAAERLFGWSAQEAVGQSIELIVPPERTGTLRRFIEGAARGEPLSPVETTHVCKDGARIPTQITFSPVRNQQGKVIAHSYTVRDMRELKRKEEALRGHAARLRELSYRLRTVEEAERRAISRELHDRIGSNLSPSPSATRNCWPW